MIGMSFTWKDVAWVAAPTLVSLAILGPSAALAYPHYNLAAPVRMYLMGSIGAGCLCVALSRLPALRQGGSS